MEGRKGSVKKIATKISRLLLWDMVKRTIFDWLKHFCFILDYLTSKSLSKVFWILQTYSKACFVYTPKDYDSTRVITFLLYIRYEKYFFVVVYQDTSKVL